MANLQRHVVWLGTIEKDGIQRKIGLYGCIGEGWAYIYVVDDENIHANAAYERFGWIEEKKARDWVAENIPEMKLLDMEYTEQL